MLRTKTFRFVFLLASVLVTTSATGPDTIVRPAKFDYTMTTLPNGLQVVFLADRAGAVPAARAVAGGRSHGLARRERREVPQRARGRAGRTAHAVRESAVRTAPRNHFRQGVHDASIQT